MHTRLLTAILSISFATTAFAQTLNGQMQTMQQRRPGMAASAPIMPAPRTTGPVDSTGNGAIPALMLTPATSNGVTYINGGISDEETAELKAKSGNYNLHVMLSAPNGEYISDVRLRILDARGASLISVDDAGPYLYAQLKPGTYTLETSTNGESDKKKKITIKSNSVIKEHIVYNQ